MAPKKSVADVDIGGKRVLLRVDYNVPFRPGTTEISDDTRIRASLPTLRYLIEKGCRVVACSHLGRPRGKVVEEMRLRPVAARLSRLLGRNVTLAPDCVGAAVQRMVQGLGPGDVLLLENLRFHPEEEKNAPEFAQALASLAEVYVNDAFGAAHRAHASTEGVTRHLPGVAGFLMAKELDMLGRTLESPARPFAAILGGAKVSDKVAVMGRLAPRVDVMLIGGGMAATFLRAKGLETGNSLVEADLVPFARDLLQEAEREGPAVHLPTDLVVGDSFSEQAGHQTVPADAVPRGWCIMDIGPETAGDFERTLAQARTVLWNGPMGVFEWAPFADGTTRVARALASLDQATTVVGGGSTAEAVAALGLEARMTHVTTGGGASLEFLEGKTLPGVAALMDADAPGPG